MNLKHSARRKTVFFPNVQIIGKFLTERIFYNIFIYFECCGSHILTDRLLEQRFVIMTL